MVAKRRVQITLIPAYFDLLDVGSHNIVLENKTQHRVHDLLLYGSARKSFDQIPGRGEHPRLAEAIHNGSGIKTAPAGVVKPQSRLHNIVARRPTEGPQVSGF